MSQSLQEETMVMVLCSHRTLVLNQCLHQVSQFSQFPSSQLQIHSQHQNQLMQVHHRHLQWQKPVHQVVPNRWATHLTLHICTSQCLSVANQ